MTQVRKRRLAALKAIASFQAILGLPASPLRIERRSDRVIALIGAAPDGREYAIGYSAAR